MWDAEAETAMKKMKRGRATGIDEVRVEKLAMAEHVGKVRDFLHKLLYADDLAVVADSGADLQERLVDWKEIFGKHGLRVSLEKTEVLWVGQQKRS